MVITQYPDTIEITTSSDSVQDVNGNWVAGTGTTVENVCRYETNDGNGYIAATDGTRIDYTAIIYLPFTAVRVKEGSRVTIVEKRGEETYTHTDIVKRFSRGQLNCRIWL